MENLFMLRGSRQQQLHIQRIRNLILLITMVN